MTRMGKLPTLKSLGFSVISALRVARRGSIRNIGLVCEVYREPRPVSPALRRSAPSVAEAGDRRAGRLKDHNAPSLHAALEPALCRDAVLCSDGDGAFATFARARGVTHYAIPARHGPRVVAGAFHIQTVNNLHAALKDFLRPFKRPTTRYLDGYLTWFIARQRRHDPWLAIIAA
jgi:hypothetical protein